MDAKKLGKKIKLARVEMDMTQADLAQATNIMQKSISRYETGQSPYAAGHAGAAEPGDRIAEGRAGAARPRTQEAFWLLFG